MSSNSSKIVIQARNLSLRYEISNYTSQTLKEYLFTKLRKNHKRQWKQALDGIRIDIRRGECVGIIGHNGSGKSTLLKTIAGILEPTTGKLDVLGSVVPMIELGAGFDPELTGKENIRLCCSLLGMTSEEIDRLSPSIEKFSELGEDLDTPIKTYSSGMYMRLGFSCSVVLSADIILIDEILAVGDQNFQQKCLARLHDLKKRGATILIVSHDMGTLKTICDRLIVLDEGTKEYDGIMEEGVEFYSRLMEQKKLELMSESERLDYHRQKNLEEGFQEHSLGQIVEITRVEVDKSSREYRSGESIKLKVRVGIKQNLDSPACIGFALQSLTQRARILGLNTKILVTEKDSVYLSKLGVYEIEFLLDELNLATGEYTVLVAAHNHDLTVTLDIQTDSVSFKVVDELDSENFDLDLLPSRRIVKSCKVSSQGLQ